MGYITSLFYSRTLPGGLSSFIASRLAKETILRKARCRYTCPTLLTYLLTLLGGCSEFIASNFAKETRLRYVRGRYGYFTLPTVGRCTEEVGGFAIRRLLLVSALLFDVAFAFLPVVLVLVLPLLLVLLSLLIVLLLSALLSFVLCLSV